MSFTVAIDGPAAAGKGTISKSIATQFGFQQLDTGLLYRAVGRKVLQGAQPIEAARNLEAADLDADDLRTPEVAQAASKVAVIAEVRQALLEFQQAFARAEPGAVLDGRDIGTVVCPNADVKLFVTASAEVRAKRRFDELSAKGMGVSPEQVLADVKARDERDRSREEAPMVAAEDAILIDTTELTIDAAIAAAADEIKARMP